MRGASPIRQVQELLKASGGVNLGMDYLPGSLGFEPLAFDVSAELAGSVLWFDAYITNVDRTWRNPNMLVWHGRPFLVDHGASLIFHHNWSDLESAVHRPYDATGHVLLLAAPDVRAADADLSSRITRDVVERVVALLPDEWLVGESGVGSVRKVREAYVRYLLARAADRSWLPEVPA